MSDVSDSASTSISAASAVHALIGHAATVAVAESLTGGLVCAALTSVPGASSVVRGAIVAYATELKADLLRVDAALLEREGAVHPEVAAPEPQDGKPVGEVHIAVSTATSLEVRSLSVDAELGRAGIRTATVDAVLVLLEQVLSTYVAPDGSE